VSGDGPVRDRHDVIVGGGCYGTFYAKQLPTARHQGKAEFARLLIVDQDRNCQFMREMGTLPWAVEERYGALRRAFEDYPRGGAFGQNDIIFFSAWMAHYVADAHVPFHAVINYDGQLTGQTGVHARFESTAFERYRDRLTIAPKPIAPIRDPRDFAFATLLASNQLVPPILKADLDAIGSRDQYDDAYYDAFFTANRAVLERRVSDAIAATAAIITGAWEAAGRPALPVNPPPRPQRRAR
jgi:hypothetical protein